jgi:hypothetical protein
VDIATTKQDFTGTSDWFSHTIWIAFLENTHRLGVIFIVELGTKNGAINNTKIDVRAC